MPNVMGVLRAEIRRLARKETKQEMGALKKQITMMRRRLAESNRRIQGLEHRARQLVRNGSGAPARGADREEEGGKQIRFSKDWVRAHRKKVGMSRQAYARLVGVSAQTIMGWEAGRTRPRRGALRTWREIRAKGVRELRAMLGGGEGGAEGAGRGGRRRRRAVRKAVRKAVRRVRARGRARVRRAARAVRSVRVARAAGGRRARAAKKK